MKKGICIVLLMAALAGCKSADPYTGETRFDDATKGGAIGAGVGAVGGALLGGTEGALIGTAVGGAIGAGTGHYFDKQEDELRSELQSTGVGIQREGDDQLKLIMPGNLTFKTGSSAISSSSYDVLTSISKVLAKYDKTFITIDGYTDSTGEDNVNMSLSEDRANAVYYYLNGRGVSKSRMVARGHGSADPIGDNSTEEGRAANRRVEIMIVGSDK